MHTRIPQTVACLLLIAPVATLAAPGDVDPEFHYPDPGILESLPDSTNAVRLPDGWLVVQSRMAESPVASSRVVLTRTDRDGRIDASYGSLGRLAVDLPGGLNVATAARRLADGSVLLGGLRRVTNGEGSVGAVVRLDRQGKPDPGFGEQGVATIDVNGWLDRVGAIESLPDGRLALLLWSRLQYNSYDCSEDQTTLVILDADGRNPRVESSSQRTSFGTASCRSQMTLQLGPDGTPVYGNELGVFGGPSLPSNWRYGPFVLNTSLGAFFSTVNGSSINVQRFGDRPVVNDDYESLGDVAGLCGPVTWNRMVVDSQQQRLYLGLESDGGQVAIARFRVDGSIDTGWGGNGVVKVRGGWCPDEEYLTTLEGLASELRLLSVEPDGAIVVATADGRLQRLSGGIGTAHGAFTLRAPRGMIPEGDYEVTVTVPRLGGAIGAVSVNYRVVACDPASGTRCFLNGYWGTARPGEDFVAASGRLDWSDGDTTERFIRIQLLDDKVAESGEWFSVELSEPGGGAGLLSQRTRIYIAASDEDLATATTPPATTPAVPRPPVVKSGGGSGSFGPGLLALLLLVAAARVVRAAPRTVGNEVYGP